jgi:hypothetical protein
LLLIFKRVTQVFCGTIREAVSIKKTAAFKSGTLASTAA